MNKLIYKLKYLTGAVAVLLFVASCQADKEVIPAKPVLPSEKSLVMNTELFDGSGASANREMVKENFGKAVVSASFWTGAANLMTFVPRLAFGAVIQSDDAEYDAEREAWVWTADFKHLAKAHVAQLVARPDGDQVNWEMWIMTEGEADFMWFDGITSVDAHNAVWNIMGKETPNQTLLTVEYEKNTEEGIWSIQYSNEGNGYIKFGVNQETDFDAFYEIYNKIDSKLFQIKWNRTEGNGYFMTPEGGKYCWDTNYDDVEC